MNEIKIRIPLSPSLPLLIQTRSRLPFDLRHPKSWYRLGAHSATPLLLLSWVQQAVKGGYLPATLAVVSVPTRRAHLWADLTVFLSLLSADSSNFLSRSTLANKLWLSCFRRSSIFFSISCMPIWFLIQQFHMQSLSIFIQNSCIKWISHIPSSRCKNISKEKGNIFVNQ